MLLEKLTRGMQPIYRSHRKAVEKIKLRNTRSILNPLRMSDNSISGSKDNEKEAFNTFKLKKKELISYW